MRPFTVRAVRTQLVTRTSTHMHIRNPFAARPANQSVLLLLLFIAISAAAQAQYFVKNPSYDKRENTSIDIEAIRFFPDSLVMDFSYYGNPDVSKPGYRINYGTRLKLRNLDDFDSYPVTKLVNADHITYTYVKKKKTELFSVVFPFSFYNLLVDGDLEMNIYNVFTTDAPFNFNFVECSTEDRTEKKIAFGSCFNFSNIKINMPPQNWAVLFCSGYLNNQLVKGEFETTAQYKKRTSLDSINLELKSQIDALYDLFSSNYINSMNNKSKSLTYNADREEFTIEYEGAEKAVVFMPLAQAPSFKSKVEDEEMLLKDVELVRLPNGRHFIEKFIYEDSKTKSKVELLNKVKLKNNPKKEFHNQVMSDLKKYYTAYKGW